MMMTITQIASSFNRTRQSVYKCLRGGKFIAKKEFGTRWRINVEDYKSYHNSRYSRKEAKKDDGSLVFDKEKGIYSVKEAADYLNQNINHVYCKIRSGKITAQRYRSAWLIHIDELNKLKEKNKQKKKA